MYEIFEHTADVGLRARADSVETLFAEAARGLFSVIVDDPAGVRCREEVPLHVDGNDTAYLLHDWLCELLYLFAGRGLLLAEFDVRVNPDGLDAVTKGEPYDPARHRLAGEVKAVTYHGLKVEQTTEGWLAEVILDL